MVEENAKEMQGAMAEEGGVLAMGSRYYQPKQWNAESPCSRCGRGGQILKHTVSDQLSATPVINKNTLPVLVIVVQTGRSPHQPGHRGSM